MMWMGLILLLLGLVLLGLAGYGYYEEKKYQPIVVQSGGLKALLEKYRMWLGLAGLILVILGGWKLMMKEGGGGGRTIPVVGDILG